MKTKIILTLILLLVGANFASAQTSDFTYQGRLSDTAMPGGGGSYTMRFRLYDALAGGNQIGSELTSAVTVSGGVFTVTLDFTAAAFTSGQPRWLEIQIGTTVLPRQRIESTPHAVRALNAGSADALSAVCVSCVTSGQIASLDGSKVSGTVANAAAAGTVTGVVAVANGGTGSAAQNFVDLTTAQSNIGGDKTFTGTLSASAVNSQSQYNIGTLRVLSIGTGSNVFVGMSTGSVNTGDDNAFVGRSAGQVNTTGEDNSFFGSSAGRNNTTGNRNSFFGRGTGQSTTTGNDNSFFGNEAGLGNTTASGNSFFGKSAGASNGTGSGNSFFGFQAGRTSTSVGNSFFGASAGDVTTTGNSNSFFGGSAGGSNTTGNANVFIGASAGFINTTGVNNLFVGTSTGQTNTTGRNNTIIGDNANVGANNLIFAAALGSKAIVSANDTIVVGKVAGNYFNPTTSTNEARPADAVIIPGSLTVSGAFSVNAVNSATQYNIGGARVLSIGGTGNLFAGINVGNVNTGSSNSFFGDSAGDVNTTGSSNSFVGTSTGGSNTTGGSNSFFGSEAGRNNRSGGGNSFFGSSAGTNTTGNNNTFVGRNAGDNNTLGTSNTVIGENADVSANSLTFATALGAGAIVSDSATVALGRSADTVFVPGKLQVNSLGAGGITPLCRNSSFQISTCQSGNSAEKSGENTTTIKALQSQNAQMIEQLKQQQLVIEALRKLVCQSNSRAEVCKGEIK